MTLPKLPIPSLELTLQNFKLATTAFLTDEEFETVSEACKELEGASGSAIQRYLLDRQEKHDNWAYDWWLEDMYLKNSLPLPIHSNPGMIFPRETFKTTEEFIRYVSCFVEEAYKFKIKIDRNLIPQDRASSRERNQPLCMLQYQRIFSSYRESGYSKDNLLEYEPNNNSHFIVAAKGQFFVVQYMTEKSTLSFEDLYIELAQIYKSSQQQQEKVGLLTAAERRHSATLFENLMKDKQNNDNVCTIRSAAFIICLDDNPGTDSESGRMAQMIHGGGVSTNSTNRWFNKTMQFIFSESGSCGLCYEHSPAEGIVVVQMVEDILKNCAERESGKIHLVENRTAKIPKKLIWKLEKCLQQEIDNIGTELDREMENLDVLIHTYDGYGKELVKKNSISPDVFIQVVLHLTYYRIYGCLGATYESASTRRFRKGRVDCIRAATPEALEWVKAMTSEGALNEERLSKFKRAVNAQTKIMTDNILGRGIDIHLMGIKEAAKELGIKLSLFDSPAFKKANHFCLSTSQITTRLNSVMGYGPVVPEGHGVSYNIQRESFKFCISSFKSFESASSKTFAKSLDESLNRVQQLLLSQNFTNRTSLV